MTIPFVGISMWVIIKLFAVISLIFYIVFALVVVRQVQLMIKTIELGFDAPLRFLSIMHLLFACSVLIFALIIL